MLEQQIINTIIKVIGNEIEYSQSKGKIINKVQQYQVLSSKRYIDAIKIIGEILEKYENVYWYAKKYHNGKLYGLKPPFYISKEEELEQEIDFLFKTIIFNNEQSYLTTEDSLFLEEISSEFVAQIIIDKCKKYLINFDKKDELAKEIDFIITHNSDYDISDLIYLIVKFGKANTLSKQEIKIINEINEKNISKAITKKRFIKKILEANINHLNDEQKINIFILLFLYNIQYTDINEKHFEIFKSYARISLDFTKLDLLFYNLNLVTTFSFFTEMAERFYNIVSDELEDIEVKKVKIKNDYRIVIKRLYPNLTDKENLIKKALITPTDTVKKKFFNAFALKIINITSVDFLHLHFLQSNFHHTFIEPKNTLSDSELTKMYINKYIYFMRSFCVYNHLYRDFENLILNNENKLLIEYLNNNYKDNISKLYKAV